MYKPIKLRVCYSQVRRNVLKRSLNEHSEWGLRTRALDKPQRGHMDCASAFSTHDDDGGDDDVAAAAFLALNKIIVGLRQGVCAFSWVGLLIYAFAVASQTPCPTLINNI